MSFIVCVTVSGAIVGATTGAAYNIFVVQEKGGVDLATLLNAEHYCDVDWILAVFSSGLGALIGTITAATAGHGAEVLHEVASQEALAQEYGFSSRDELIERANEEGLSIREFLNGWDPDSRQFRPEELEQARKIEELERIRLVRKRPDDPGNYDWVGSNGEFYDALGMTEEGGRRPPEEQSSQFIDALDRHMRDKAGPNGEPALLPVSIEEADPKAAETIKEYIEGLPEHLRRRIIPLDF